MDMDRRDFFRALAASAVASGCILPVMFPSDPERWVKYYAAQRVGDPGREFDLAVEMNLRGLENRGRMDGLKVRSVVRHKGHYEADKDSWLIITTAMLG